MVTLIDHVMDLYFKILPAHIDTAVLNAPSYTHSPIY